MSDSHDSRGDPMRLSESNVSPGFNVSGIERNANGSTRTFSSMGSLHLSHLENPTTFEFQVVTTIGETEYEPIQRVYELGQTISSVIDDIIEYYKQYDPNFQDEKFSFQFLFPNSESENGVEPVTLTSTSTSDEMGKTLEELYPGVYNGSINVTYETAGGRRRRKSRKLKKRRKTKSTKRNKRRKNTKK
jgi:hypothetical protein